MKYKYLAFGFFAIIVIGFIAKISYNLISSPKHILQTTPAEVETEYNFKSFCTPADLHTNLCAEGDFDGDGKLDQISEAQSNLSKDYFIFIRFSGDEKPIPLSDLQMHSRNLEGQPLLKISDESAKSDFLKLQFEPVIPAPSSGENSHHGMAVPSVRICFANAPKGRINPAWKSVISAETSRDLVESFACDSGGGRSLYLFDRATKRMIMYFSTAMPI